MTVNDSVILDDYNNLAKLFFISKIKTEEFCIQ